MPLQRWPNGSSRPHAWGIEFRMMTRDGKPIRCRVMRATLEKLLGDTR